MSSAAPGAERADLAIMAAVASLRPGAAWNFSYGKGTAGLNWLDGHISRPSDAEIAAEMARLAALPIAAAAAAPPSALQLDQHLARSISEFTATSGEMPMSDTVNTGAETPVPSLATPLPPPPTITAAPAPATRRPAPVGSFAAGIRAIMDEARQGVERARAEGLAEVQDAVDKLTEAKEATRRVAGRMAQTIHDEAADVMAELGQISNDL